MKLAIKKELGENPLGGFHYMLVPFPMGKGVMPDAEKEAAFYELIGHIIIEVSDEEGERYCKEAAAALNHQMGIAYLAEATLAKKAGIAPAQSPDAGSGSGQPLP